MDERGGQADWDAERVTLGKHFLRDMEGLWARVLKQAAVVEDALNTSVRALCDGRADLAANVKGGDKAIDRWEIQIERDCLRVLALHQPVASDLRRIAVVLRINNDLERMADLARHIAKLRFKKLANCCAMPPTAIPEELESMAVESMAQVRDSLDALIKGDADLARRVIGGDRRIDRHQRLVRKGLKDAIRRDPDRLNTSAPPDATPGKWNLGRRRRYHATAPPRPSSTSRRRRPRPPLPKDEPGRHRGGAERELRGSSFVRRWEERVAGRGRSRTSLPAQGRRSGTRPVAAGPRKPGRGRVPPASCRCSGGLAVSMRVRKHRLCRRRGYAAGRGRAAHPFRLRVANGRRLTVRGLRVRTRWVARRARGVVGRRLVLRRRPHYRRSSSCVRSRSRRKPNLSLRRRDARLLADRPRRVVFDLPVTRTGGMVTSAWPCGDGRGVPAWPRGRDPATPPPARPTHRLGLGVRAHRPIMRRLVPRDRAGAGLPHHSREGLLAMGSKSTPRGRGRWGGPRAQSGDAAGADAMGDRRDDPGGRRVVLGRRRSSLAQGRRRAGRGGRGDGRDDRRRRAESHPGDPGRLDERARPLRQSRRGASRCMALVAGVKASAWARTRRALDADEIDSDRQ